MAGDSNGIGSFPYIFALLLSCGSLVTYLLGAIVSRYTLGEEGKTAKAFNLGIPISGRPETLFAISLAAAQTTLSTVFVAFLTGAGYVGLHFLYCPLAFAAGNWLMLVVYNRIDQHGYIDDSAVSGLIPYFVYQLTKSRFVSSCLAVVCILPVGAVLALELYYGSGLLDHLGQRALGLDSASPLISFTIFIGFMVPLLGYVFVGGFRAVINSDVWQYRIMAATLFLVSLSALWLVRTRPLHWERLGNHSGSSLVPFYVSVTLINLFQPLCFATTWQRFRAFRELKINFTAAIWRATTRVAFLWIMLIIIGVCIQLASQVPAGGTESFPLLLDRVAALNIWFRLFVFPLFVVAAFSGMYSSSDTCISALLYLTETDRAWHLQQLSGEVRLRRHYYWVMAAVFVLTFAMYMLVRRVVEPGILNPTTVAIILFGNAIVLAPTVLLIASLNVYGLPQQTSSRTMHVGASVGLGLVAYWLVYATSPARDPVWATVAGLATSAIPACFLLLRERSVAQYQREGESCSTS